MLGNARGRFGLGTQADKSSFVTPLSYKNDIKPLAA